MRVFTVLAVAALALETTLIANQIEVEEMKSAQNEKLSSKVLDIEPTKAFTPVAGSLHDMLQAAGHSEWSEARLLGVLGNAFSFETRKNAKRVWQEANLDWWLFLEILPELELGCRIQRFQVRQEPKPDSRGSGFRPQHQGKSKALKAAAWNAVRASIDRGIPAVAWNPMSFEQAEAGLSARDWGLIVGYDELGDTYTVRHKYVHSGPPDYAPKDFTVRYDAIGHTEPSELFCVLVYDGPESVDEALVHVWALRNAVAFANGTRYDPKESTYHVDARGFAALELWGEALKSGTADPELARYQIRELRELRGYAAAYLREIVGIFPAAASELEKAAEQYDGVVEVTNRLHALCEKAKESGEFRADAGVEARNLVAVALQAEREAIVGIKATLALVEETR